MKKTKKTFHISSWKLMLSVAVITFLAKTYIFTGTGKFETFKNQHTQEQLEKICPPDVSQRFYQCVKADFDTFISVASDLESLEMLAFMQEISKMDYSREVTSEGKIQSRINFLTISKFISENRDTDPTHQKVQRINIDNLKLQIDQSNVPNDKKQMFLSSLEDLRI